MRACGKISRKAERAAVAMTASPMQQGRMKMIRRGSTVIGLVGRRRAKAE